MKAGPELDALVAEHVMGVKWDETRCRGCGWPFVGQRDEHRHRQPAQGLPPFSTNREGAMHVADELVRRGFWMRIHSTQRGVDWWTVEFIFDKAELGPPYHPVHEGRGDTLALAICLAALEAVGHEAAE